MNEKRHEIAVHEEKLSPLGNFESIELVTIEESASCCKMVDHDWRVFGMLRPVAEGAERDVRRDSFKDEF